MADQIIDRLVSSLAAGLMGPDEFIDAVQHQVSKLGRQEAVTSRHQSGDLPLRRTT